MRLAIVTTHPIQYNAPWFKLLSEKDNVELMVFYTWEQSQTKAKYDPDFGKTVEWDIPLLDGYNYTFVKNTAQNAGSHHFKGIVNPTLNKEITEWGAGALMVLGWAYKSHLDCIRYFKGKIPVLFRGDSTLLDEKNGIKQLLRRMFLKYVYSNVDFVLYVGSNNKDYYKVHGVKEHQMIHVPHAIDNKRFSSADTERYEEVESLRTSMGIHSDAFVILYAGKFIQKKNPSFILQLSKLLPNENVVFIMVGDGILAEELKQQAQKDKRIHFAGFQNQTKMPLYYALSDVFVLPSRGPNETWGLAINEAMAANNFIITTNKVGCAIDLVSNDNGIIINSDDVNTASEYIQKIISNKSAELAMQDTNKKILSNYSYESVVNNIEQLLKNICEKS